MQINIILTSYNRPVLLKRAVDSIINQTDQEWRLWLQDDNSDEETQDYIDTICDPRITVGNHKTAPAERKLKSRYAVLINEIVHQIPDGSVVGYLCDNVEYYPTLVAKVRAFFETYSEAYMAYVPQLRDVWMEDGRSYRGTAAQFQHWAILPPAIKPLEANVFGILDHSQVFHRTPAGMDWSEDITTVHNGDGLFYTLLATRKGPIYPIVDYPLTMEHLLR
jgi:spore maturation protein CgeD